MSSSDAAKSFVKRLEYEGEHQTTTKKELGHVQHLAILDGRANKPATLEEVAELGPRSAAYSMRS